MPILRVILPVIMQLPFQSLAPQPIKRLITFDNQTHWSVSGSPAFTAAGELITRRSSQPDWLQREQRLHGLAPKRRLAAAEALKYLAIMAGEVQERISHFVCTLAKVAGGDCTTSIVGAIMATTLVLNTLLLQGIAG